MTHTISTNLLHDRDEPGHPRAELFNQATFTTASTYTGQVTPPRAGAAHGPYEEGVRNAVADDFRASQRDYWCVCRSVPWIVLH